jgi:hypothetical protein
MILNLMVMQSHFSLKKLDGGCFLILMMMLCSLHIEAQSPNYQENPSAKRVYSMLRKAFPNSFFENIDNYYARYDVSGAFLIPSEYRKSRELISHVRLALDSIKCVRKVSDVTDSGGVTKINYVMMTYDSIMQQRDYISFNANESNISYQYRVNLQGAGVMFKLGKTIPDNYILVRFDSLFNSYAKRKGVKKVAVEYQGEYVNNIFQISNNWLNNRTGGYKYIVPSCSESDFHKFVSFFRYYSQNNNISFINMTNPNSDEEVEIELVRHDGHALEIAAKLKGTDLYLLYVISKEDGVNSKNTVLPFGWDEDVEPWKLNVSETPKANDLYIKNGEKIYLSVDRESSFPGGSPAMKKFINEHINSSIPSDPQVSGYNMVQFIVGVNGVVRDAHIVKSLNAETDAESMRVINMMPKWNPAVKKGKKVSSSIIIPITYKIND